MAWPVFDEPADDDPGNAGGNEHNPDRRHAIATRVADPHLSAVVESDDDNQGDDRRCNQQPDDPAELSPALDDNISMPSFNNGFPCHDPIPFLESPNYARKLDGSNAVVAT